MVLMVSQYQLVGLSCASEYVQVQTEEEKKGKIKRF